MGILGEQIGGLGIARFGLEEVKVLVLDVDDTVTRGTSGAKSKVWDQLFADRMNKLQEARELFESTGKGDRYNMIAHVIGEPQEKCRENQKVKKWADKFEAATAERIRQSGIHEDDLTSLKELRENFKVPIFLLSATPQATVDANINHFEKMHPEIQGMFTNVIGTPMAGGSKAGELLRLADQNSVLAEEMLLVGDGQGDHDAAEIAGTQFVGVIPSGKKDKWPQETFPKVQSIAALPELLKENALGR